MVHASRCLTHSSSVGVTVGVGVSHSGDKLRGGSGSEGSGIRGRIATNTSPGHPARAYPLRAFGGTANWKCQRYALIQVVMYCNLDGR